MKGSSKIIQLCQNAKDTLDRNLLSPWLEYISIIQSVPKGTYKGHKRQQWILNTTNDSKHRQRKTRSSVIEPDYELIYLPCNINQTRSWSIAMLRYGPNPIQTVRWHMQDAHIVFLIVAASSIDSYPLLNHIKLSLKSASG